MAQQPSIAKHRILLHHNLAKYFSVEELRDLSFDLGVEYDSLPGEGKEAKTRELVDYLERRGRIPDLVEAGRRLRPRISWEEDTSAPGSPATTAPPSQPSRTGLSLLVILFFNLVILGALTYLLENRVSLQCVRSSVSAASLATGLVLIFHLAWRYLGPAIKALGDAIKVEPFAIPVRLIATLLDALHPSSQALSNRALWLSSIVLAVMVGLFGPGPLSPFRPSEAVPVVQSFSVRRLDGATVTLKPNDVMEIKMSEQVLVEATTYGSANMLCVWHAATGTLQPATGCATLYSPHFEGANDTLVIVAQSPCNQQQAFAGLHIKVVSNRP